MLSDHRLPLVALLFEVLPFDGASSSSAPTPDLRMLATLRCNVVVDDLISCTWESTRVSVQVRGCVCVYACDIHVAIVSHSTKHNRP